MGKEYLISKRNKMVGREVVRGDVGAEERSSDRMVIADQVRMTGRPRNDEIVQRVYRNSMPRFSNNDR